MVSWTRVYGSPTAGSPFIISPLCNIVPLWEGMSLWSIKIHNAWEGPELCESLTRFVVGAFVCAQSVWGFWFCGQAATRNPLSLPKLWSRLPATPTRSTEQRKRKQTVTVSKALIYRTRKENHIPFLFCSLVPSQTSSVVTFALVWPVRWTGR